MNKYYIGVLAFAFIIPLVSQAQVVCPRGYTCVPIISTPTTPPTIPPINNPSCYVFNTNLRVGSTGTDVVALQITLMANGYDIPNITSGRSTRGYFEYQTQSAVKLYQAAKGIPNTGFVGPITRALLNASCGSTPTTPTPAPQTNDYPVITSLQAPASLNTNQSGTWVVYASDTESSQLSYTVDWGDSSESTSRSFVYSPQTFTHAYANSGTYTVTFTVKDSSGQTVGRTLPIQVITVVPLQPQLITSATYHSADLNHDWRIDANELATFQDLYNYRSGTVRTGEYSIGMNGAYIPGPGNQTGPTHSGDEDKNWRISLPEFTRIIEFYNASGGYKVQTGTEDGYEAVNN